MNFTFSLSLNKYISLRYKLKYTYAYCSPKYLNDKLAQITEHNRGVMLSDAAINVKSLLILESAKHPKYVSIMY